MSKHDCPRCGGGIPNDANRGMYPGALSRWDNETEVCSRCGQEEAMLDFEAGMYRAEGRNPLLDPTTGRKPWKTVP